MGRAEMMVNNRNIEKQKNRLVKKGELTSDRSINKLEDRSRWFQLCTFLTHSVDMWFGVFSTPNNCYQALYIQRSVTREK